jgi:YD repeat-containing protein
LDGYVNDANGNVTAATDTLGTTVYASYDAVGDLVCWAPTSATTCSGIVAGQQRQ